MSEKEKIVEIPEAKLTKILCELNEATIRIEESIAELEEFKKKEGKA